MQGTKNQESRTQSFALALHTTTDNLELAIARLGSSSVLKSSEETKESDRNLVSDFILLKEQSWHLGRELSTQLHGCLSAFICDIDLSDRNLSDANSGNATSGASMGKITWSDIAWLAIAKGIGGYTGTRMGIVTARTLAEQLDIPLYAIECDTISERAQRSQLHKSLSHSLLEIACKQWQIEVQQGVYSHWSQAVPLYRESS